MSRLFTFCLSLVLFGIVASSHGDEETKPFGLEKREPWTTSKVVGTPEPPPPYTIERIYPEIKFQNPVFIAQEPGTDRLLVAELGGKIFAFSMTNPVPETKELFLDIERQLYAFSFHPDYETNGQIFTFSPTDPKDAEKPSKVSRFVTTLDHPRKTSLEHETVIIEWTAGGHNGGEAIIGPDGYLYISTGDSTSGSDPKATGQGVDDLFAVMMRLDVEHPDEGRAYSIPPDNPFVDFPGARPEIWAHGFRNPWRFSFDEEGRLWCGDVGQDIWEMIWLVEKGGNYGWSVQEGSHPFHPEKPVGPGPILPPVVEHHHTECRSITGGYMYNGEKHPELKGVYFYGDHEYGTIWGFRYEDGQVVDQRVLADTAQKIPTFAVQRDGEILFCDHSTGELFKLVKAPETTGESHFPRTLSETGLFASVADHQLASGIIPYSVNTPQWVDGGHKQRFFGLPGESKATFSAGGGPWGFDNGTVIAETISFDMEEGNPASRKRVETRILVQQQTHWLGYSYLWNDEQTDATLVERLGTDLKFQIKTPDAPEGVREQTWHVPSRQECMVCHSRAAAFVLGLRTEQINRDHDYGGIVDNQLRTLDHIGLFTANLTQKPEELMALKNPYDETLDLNDRARAYLYVNCSVCHVDDGGGNSKIVMSYSTTPENMRVFGEKPMHGHFGLADASVITPGDPFASVLFYRLSKVGRGRMPHVGSNLTDRQALDVIRDWIAQMPAADENANPANAAAEMQALKDSLLADPANALPQALSTTRSALMLATIVGDGELPVELQQEVIAQGIASREPNVRDLFERFIPESQRTKLIGDFVNVDALLNTPGDAERGRELFFNAAGLQCRNCHRVNNIGNALGADLNEIGKKYKRHEILESLIDPSKKIDPKFATVVVVKTDGMILNGIVIEKTEEATTLNVLKEGKGEQVRITAEEIDEIIPQTKSLMPDRQLRDLTPQQAADLLEFLTTLK
ncbi:MAG: PQQ-dependent sugar dehydrogenase [Planctomycetota bacterium]|nr:PQQ-dependent sugar dehydrogenase [Planctomycetota bacterium]MDA1214471.1 PQQ-dependent sugar dehydrogenase [Planctomycetota bacterium]